jgi:hypothetical protein
MNGNALLARLRLERLRQHIQHAAVELNLAEEFDDFEEGADDQQGETDMY